MRSYFVLLRRKTCGWVNDDRTFILGQTGFL